MHKFGFPEKYVKILRLLHDNMMAVVKMNNTTSDSFPIKTGVKQGCVIAPCLFNIYLTTLLLLIRDDLPLGLDMRYRLDGKLLNLRKLKAKSKVIPSSVLELQYADDSVISANSREDTQRALDLFNYGFRMLGLNLNALKTKVLVQPKPGKPIAELTHTPIVVNGQALEFVEHFNYLGSILSSTAMIDKEIEHIISSAVAAFGRMRGRVFNCRDLSKKTKLAVYNAAILPILTYGSETWITYRKHLKSLERFNQRCLPDILRIHWEERRTNVSVLEEAKSQTINSKILLNQLRWAGHCVRMDDERLPKQVLYSELMTGKRTQGGQRKRWKDTLKANLKMGQIDLTKWENETLDRKRWRHAIHEAQTTAENHMREHENEKRRRRKERQRNPQTRLPTNTACPHCPKVCRSRIGLLSHLRSHPPQPL